MKRIGIECESIENKEGSWGVAKIITELLKELSRRPELISKFRFVLYFKNTIPDFEYLNNPIFEKKIVPVPFFRNRLFPIYYFLLLPIKLWFERLDWMYWPNYMLPVMALNRSVVILTEDIYYEVHSGKLPFRYKLAYRIFGGWTARKADKIMAISETSKNNLVKLYGIKPKRIFVNHLGIEEPTGSNSGQTGDYILYVGQAFPRRHLRETILGFEKIEKEFPGLRLIAIGPDKYDVPVINGLVLKINSNLKREAIIHKDYIEQDELNNLYSMAKCLVYVSDREAFGLPPLEALAMGIPPVIADNELGHEIFGDNAFYAKHNDTDGIAEAIRKALTESDKIKNIRQYGPALADKYNWHKFTDKFLKEIEN